MATAQPKIVTNQSPKGKTTVVTDNANATQDETCVLTINGRTYDMTNWANKHPGGPIIHIYNGRDATEVFKAFHGQDAHKLLSSFPSVPAETATATTTADAKAKEATAKKDAGLVKGLNSEAIMKDFVRLRQDLEKEGMFESSMVWFWFKMFQVVGMLPLAYYLNTQGWYVLSAIVLGTMWQQLGWTSHELLHHQVYMNRTINNFIAWFSGCVLLGFSCVWWNDRHNAHHAATNIDGSDPDIDNLPLLAWSASDVKRASPGERKLIKYQAYYFWFILPLLNIIWCTNSIFFVKDVMRTSKYRFYRSRWVAEAIGISLHYCGLIAFLYTTLPSVSAAILYFIAAKLVGGSFLAFVVFFNHYSCPKLDFDSVAGENYVIMQLVSTRNMTPGTFTDWFWGGLNYQVEHHLFPTMPRHNMYKCSLRVRAFCKKHNLPYLCSDFGEGVGYIKSFLEDIAKLA